MSGDRVPSADMRVYGEAFCADCPDHEACMTGYPCDFVRRIDARARRGRQIRDEQIRLGMTTEGGAS